jgi:transcriptional regulator with XRE-family HTH domain
MDSTHIAPVDPLILVLKMRRERLGLSQADLSRRIPCAGGLISRAERGLHAPTLPILRRWASVLGMDLGLLIKEGAEDAATHS